MKITITLGDLAARKLPPRDRRRVNVLRGPAGDHLRRHRVSPLDQVWLSKLASRLEL
ncbi:hypothetical protein [Heliomarina baculiformis]|uniref:hypothetical protein n=1 Tax=Heliomarina baculiformis TaxID=2872036 RepID=UPI001EE342AF|nr:hypothetical protein [Heliomarina baculiformis]